MAFELRKLLMGKNVKNKHKSRLWDISEYCWLCFEKIETYEEATIDHVVPSSWGGLDNFSNKQLTHKECNQKKGNKFMKLKLLALKSHLLKNESNPDDYRTVQVFPMSIESIEPDPIRKNSSIINLKSGKTVMVQGTDDDILAQVEDLRKRFAEERR